MLAIQIWAKDENFGKERANQLRAYIDRMQISNAIIIGPAFAAISKINDIYRIIIYIKHEESEELMRIKDALENVLNYWETKGVMRQLQVQFDFDPMNFM